jgi:CHAT domain-containing protein
LKSKRKPVHQTRATPTQVFEMQNHPPHALHGLTLSASAPEGPITLEQTFPLVAYVHKPGGGLPMLCIAAHLDDHHMLLEHMGEFVKESYRYVTTQLTNWRELDGVVSNIGYGCKGMTIQAVTAAATDSLEFGRAALRNLTLTFVRKIGGVRCVVRQSPPEGDDIRCRYDFWREEAPQNQGHVYLEDDPDHAELDKALETYVGLSKTDVLRETDRGLYVAEAAFLEDPLGAFRSFSHAAVLSPDRPGTDVLLTLGQRVWDLLASHAMLDYAEWVAGMMVRLAKSAGIHTAELDALRLQGISQAGLGCWNAAMACFERALSLLPGVGDVVTEARLRMSCGLAICDLSAHWETLDAQTRARLLPELHPRIDMAERELLAAQDLFSESQAPSAARNRVFIGLELLRIRDLRGDHQGALAALSEIETTIGSNGADFSSLDAPDRTKFSASVAHYRLCAALKEYEVEVERQFINEDNLLQATRRLLGEELPRAVIRVNALPHKTAIVDRLCYIAVLAANVFVDLALGRHEVGWTKAPASKGALAANATATLLKEYRSELQQARCNLETALTLRRALETREARPPLAGMEYGGLSAVDIIGTLQHCLLLLAHIDRDPSLAWQAFAEADECKGRFFKRDLAFSGWKPVAPASATAASTADELRAAILRGEADNRLLMADLEWSLKQDFSPEVVEEFRRATALDVALGPDEIHALLEGGCTPSAVLAFYASERGSLAYLLTSTDHPPKVTRLAVRVDELEQMASELTQTVAQELRHGPKTEQGALPPALEQLLLPLLDHLPEVSRLVIVPHGAWHDIPIHAILLPRLWSAGRDFGISYAPSLRAMALLKQRRDTRSTLQRSAIAVATVPAREDPATVFEEEHRHLVEVLRGTHRCIDAAFGTEATLDRLLLQSGSAGIRHLIAHGIDAGSDHAMQSGVLVANQSGLPTRDGAMSSSAMLTATLELAHPTSASHVTVQACELGRLHGAHRDELWGVVRALIAGGANSVLAPSWEVSLRSSGTLLRDFYRLWLLDGGDPALALARAQRAMAEGENAAWRHFAHWGAFQLTGC